VNSDARYTPEEIARVVHAAMRELQAIQGDRVPAPPWDETTAEMRGVAVAGVRAVSEDGLSAAGMHAVWMERMTHAGYRWGPDKDAAARTHPCLVDWLSLPLPQRDKDTLAAAIVMALS